MSRVGIIILILFINKIQSLIDVSGVTDPNFDFQIISLQM